MTTKKVKYVPMVQQLTREGNILRRSRKADPMGDMQITRWMQERTLVTYWAKILTFVGGMRFLWQSTLDDKIVFRRGRKGQRVQEKTQKKGQNTRCDVKAGLHTTRQKLETSNEVLP